MKRTQRWISLVLSMALVLSAMPVIAVGEHNVLLPDTKFNEPLDAIEEDIALEVGSTDDGLRDTNDSKESISLMDDTSSVGYEVDGGTLYFNTATGTITYFSAPVSSGSNPSFEISIPSEIEGVAVTAIGEGAFESCNRLLSITLPDSVTTIGEAAFEYCYRLLDIKFPDSLTTIDNYAFKDCDALTEISIGKNITSLQCSRLYQQY